MGAPLPRKYCTVAVLALALGFSMVRNSLNELPVYPSAKYQVLCTVAATTVTATGKELKTLPVSCTKRFVVYVCGVFPIMKDSVNCPELCAGMVPLEGVAERKAGNVPTDQL